jgi:hypothetical protein
MKRNLIALLAVIFSAIAHPVSANEEINGVTINRVYVDPSDVVVLTDTSNGCGSNFFHLPRSNDNFKEMHAYMFLAFKNQTTINFNVTDGCQGDRRFISHGSMETQ